MKDTPEAMVASLEAKRVQEQRDRQIDAQHVARALSNLMLGETLEISAEATVMAVPNGWLFTTTHEAGITSCFVPGMGPPPGVANKKADIYVPPGL